MKSGKISFVKQQEGKYKAYKYRGKKNAVFSTQLHLSQWHWDTCPLSEWSFVTWRQIWCFPPTYMGTFILAPPWKQDIFSRGPHTLQRDACSWQKNTFHQTQSSKWKNVRVCFSRRGDPEGNGDNFLSLQWFYWIALNFDREEEEEEKKFNPISSKKLEGETIKLARIIYVLAATHDN